jgi:hypothetical protein
VNVVRTGLRYDVDDTARCPAVLGTRASCDHRNSLTASSERYRSPHADRRLLAEESIVVVTAIEADIVENAALPGEVDLVTVGALRDAHARRQCQRSSNLRPRIGVFSIEVSLSVVLESVFCRYRPSGPL